MGMSWGVLMSLAFLICFIQVNVFNLVLRTSSPEKYHLVDTIAFFGRPSSLYHTILMQRRSILYLAKSFNVEDCGTIELRVCKPGTETNPNYTQGGFLSQTSYGLRVSLRINYKTQTKETCIMLVLFRIIVIIMIVRPIAFSCFNVFRSYSSGQSRSIFTRNYTVQDFYNCKTEL